MPSSATFFHFGPAASFHEIFRSPSSAYVLVIVFIFGINYNRNDFLGALNLNLVEDDKENENDEASQAGEGTESNESQSASAASATPAIITPALSLTGTLTPSTGRLLQQWHRLRRLPQHRPFLNLRSTSTDAQGRSRTSLCS